MVNYNGLGSKFNPDVRKIVESLFAFLQGTTWGAGIWPGSGWRTGSKEHATGRAIDIITSTKVGQRPTAEQKAAADKLVELLLKHGKALKIQWVLFSRDGKATHSYNFDRGSWNVLGDRGSVSANHVDHIHVYFKSGARLPSGFSWGTATAPKPPSTGGPGTAPAKPTVRLNVIKAQANASKRTSTADVTVYQQALAAAGFNPGKIDGYYGPATRKATTRLQQSMGFRGTAKGGDADGRPGWKSLQHLAQKTGKFTAKK